MSNWPYPRIFSHRCSGKLAADATRAAMVVAHHNDDPMRGSFSGHYLKSRENKSIQD
ncbi:glycerophosphodiester phosphodiesterase [Escherichia coli]|nr:glycerophosphodiester phosphodiesterase [Escherichia coli]